MDTSQAQPSGWRILVVEDEPFIANTIERALRSVGHAVEIADNADSALQMAHRNVPDLVLLDVHMPGGDGFGVLSELRRSPATQDIAVIMVTALRNEGYVIQGLQQADDYICKPFSITELVARINAVMRRVPARARTA